MKFSELELHNQTMGGIKASGFVNCTDVQSKALPIGLSGEDLMVQSKTGSGKTAVFILSFLEKYLYNKERNLTSKCLIVAPTRELAQQIASDAKKLCSKTKDFTIGCFFGGVGYESQKKLLKKGCDIIVGTPGRLLDFIKGGQLDISCVDTFVLDEADRMFDMGFLPDIRTIFRFLPPKEKRQTMLFSATLEERVRELAWEYMNDCQVVEMESDHITVDKITQELYHVAKSEKFMLFLQLLASEKPKAALVFTNSRYMTEEVSRRLILNGYNATYLSGNLSQKARDKALSDLKSGKISILVATDVAARGLQIDDLPLVVNYDIPEDYENYVHRIGRTARAGKSGKAISLADEEFVYGLEAIEKYIKMKIPVIWPDNLPEVEDKSLRSSSKARSGTHSSVDKKITRKNTKEQVQKQIHRQSSAVKPTHSLGKMTEKERLEYYKKKYGFEPVKKKHCPMFYLFWAVPFVLVAFVLQFTVGTMLSFVLRIFGKKVSDNWLFFISKIFSKFFLFLLGVKVHVSGDLSVINSDEPICFVSNHTSILDVLLVFACTDAHTGFVAKKELAWIPFFNLSVLSHHVVFIDRSNLKRGIKAIERAVAKIKKGNNMLIYPEGSRSKTGVIAPFRQGSFRLASQSGAKIVPITVKGVRSAFEDRKKCFQHTVCYLNVGKSFDTSGISDRNGVNILANKIETYINSVYQSLGRNSNRSFRGKNGY